MSTDLENFLATAEHRSPKRILYTFDMTPDLEKRVRQHIGTEHWGPHFGCYFRESVEPDRPDSLPRPDYSSYWKDEQLPEGTTIGDLGIAYAPGGYYHFVHVMSPLRNATKLADIENFPMDDVSLWDFSHLNDKVRAAHAAGKVASTWVGHMYENAWASRGYEEFLVDMMERPAWAECLLERLAQRNRIRAVAGVKAGIDLLICGDDVANQQALMFPPPLWRKMMHSRWARIWAEAKSINPKVRIWYHSDGNVTEIVDDLLQAGLDILNPVQPECMDEAALYQRYGRKLSFEGMMGTQSTMPFGTPQAVRARVKELIEKYGRNGGLILAPTHTLEPEVPIANIEAFCEACREYGTFE